MSSHVARMIPDDADQPVPVRYWWLKRILIGCGCLLLGLVLLRLWWGYEANRRLQAEIQRYRAAGEPVFVEDFAVVLPDDQNAVVLIDEAIGSLTAVTNSGVLLDDLAMERRACLEAMGDVKTLIELNSGVLALLHEARSRPRAGWAAPAMTQAQFATHVAWLGNVRSLSRLLWLSSFYEFHTGKHENCIEAQRDFLAIGGIVNSYPTQLAILGGELLYSLVADCVEDASASLSIASSPPDIRSAGSAAPRRDVEQFILELLDESSRRQDRVRAIYGDRTYYLDALDLGAGRGLGLISGLPDALTKPIQVLDMIRKLRSLRLEADAAGEDSWPTAIRHFPAVADQESRNLLEGFTRPITDSLFFSPRRTEQLGIQIHFSRLARRRMAATALAIRLFELDRGHRPGRLTELVPDYLSSVPQDPFDPDGGPIRYRPGGDDPMLYSVGVNGFDEGGVFAMTPDGQVDWQKDRRDILFHLNGRPMAKAASQSAGTVPAPLPQAGDDDDDREDDGWDDDEREDGGE